MLVELQIGAATLTINMRFLRTVGMDPPFGPAIPLLGLYPKGLKSAYYSDAATSVFIEVQVTKARL